MTAAPLVVIETGRANLASVRAAFRRLGADAIPTADPDVVRDAARVVLPGVGAFGSVAVRLAAAGIDAALRERMAAGRPVLAICLGMQLLAPESDETPGARGLAVIESPVRRLALPAKAPQLGWNAVGTARAGGLVHDGYAFFANSYCLNEAPAGWTAAWADHGAPFVAAIERGPQLACQFHPELSGAWGAGLLARWLSC